MFTINDLDYYWFLLSDHWPIEQYPAVGRRSKYGL